MSSAQADSSNHEMKIDRLIDFKWIILNEVSSNNCQNLNEIRVLLIFKISDDNGDIVTRNLEVSLEEALALKNELSSAVDMLN